MAAFGTEVDDVVRGLDDVEVMLDEQHRVAGVDEPVQRFEQPLTSARCRPVVGSSRM